MPISAVLVGIIIVLLISNIFLIIRVAVLRNYLHLFETRMGEIEARLGPKKQKGTERLTTHGLKTREFETGNPAEDS